MFIEIYLSSSSGDSLFGHRHRLGLRPILSKISPGILPYNIDLRSQLESFSQKRTSFGNTLLLLRPFSDS